MKIKKIFKSRKNLIAVLATLGIILTTVGVTYAFFSYSRTGIKTNTITSGKITFHYEEGNRQIALNDAMPMTDEQGKTQNDYFDFEITADTAKNMNIPYVVTARVDPSSTLPPEYVKIYVTDQSNNMIEPIKFFDAGSLLGRTCLLQYSEIPVSKYMEKVVYEGNVSSNSSDYSKKFRVRIWISDDINMNANNDGISIYNNASFKITFNVYAAGANTTEEEENRKANTNIDEIIIGTDTATTNDGIHYELDTVVTQAIDSKTISINTVNPNATVLIEKVNSVGMKIPEKGIKRLSLSNAIELTPGTNYFRITVKPENKSDPTIYYLTIQAYMQYAITYDLNGGTQGADAVTSYTSQTATFNLPYPTKDGFVFGGWYENSEFTGSVVTQINQGSTGNKVYYAKWNNPPKLTTYLRELTSSDVVQDDLSGDANMRFVGTAPNNYVNFVLSDGTKEKWRIIGVFNQNSHGYDGDLVKIVRDQSLPAMKINDTPDTGSTTYSNNWNTSTLKNLLDSTTYKYAASDYSQSVIWQTGAVSWSEVTQHVNGTYAPERGDVVSNASTLPSGYQTTATGTVGLPYYSDIFFSTDGNAGATAISTCLNSAYTAEWNYPADISSTSAKNCTKGAWMLQKYMGQSTYAWVLDAYVNNPNFIRATTGSIGTGSSNNAFLVYPTLYLNNNVRINGGHGTFDSPYELAL